MGLRINNNLESMDTLRHLNNAQSMFSKSLQRLSSGKRINSAADDAAGYAISQKLLAQSNGLNQAYSNAQDGVSLVQTANGGLQTIQDMLQRLRQLAVQSANDTNTSSDRTALQNEADQINQEITQIASTTQFNTLNLLNGQLGSTGTLASSNILPGITGSTANASTGSLTSGTYTFTMTSAKTGDVAFTGTTKGQALGTTTVTNNTLLSTGNGVALATGNHTLTITGALGAATIGIQGTQSYGDVMNAINQVSAQTGVTAAVDTTANEGGLSLQSTVEGSKQNFSVAGDAANTLIALGLQAAGATATTLSAGSGIIAGTNATATLTDSNGKLVATMTGNGNAFTDAATGFSLDLNKGKVTDGATITAGTNDTGTIAVVNNGANLQVGANSSQSLSVTVGDMRSAALGIQSATNANQALDISSSSTVAGTQISIVDSAIQKVSAQAALLGAVQNRLQSAMSNLAIGAENLTASYSAITNVNMAQETTSLATAQILNQSSTAMLAQANQSPQGVLKLLG